MRLTRLGNEVREPDPLRVIIMDFDGVVIESNAVKTEAFQKVFSRFPEYTHVMMDFHSAHVSVSRFVKFEHLMGLMGKSSDTELMGTIAADFSNRVVQGILDVPLVPGAETFLTKVTQRVPVYLASVTPAEELALVLARRGLTRWFRRVYGCPPWTKPDAIRDVVVREGILPQDVLLIGDSAGDQRAAQEIGVRFLARDSGLIFHEPAPLCFADLNEIGAYLEELLP